MRSIAFALFVCGVAGCQCPGALVNSVGTSATREQSSRVVIEVAQKAGGDSVSPQPAPQAPPVPAAVPCAGPPAGSIAAVPVPPASLAPAAGPRLANLGIMVDTFKIPVPFLRFVAIPSEQPPVVVQQPVAQAQFMTLPQMFGGFSVCPPCLMPPASAGPSAADLDELTRRVRELRSALPN